MTPAFIKNPFSNAMGDRRQGTDTPQLGNWEKISMGNSYIA